AHSLVTLRRTPVMPLPCGLEVENGEPLVELADARELPDLSEEQNRREERVLRDLWRRTAVRVLLRDELPELRSAHRVMRARLRPSDRTCVVGRFARDRRCCRELFLLARGRERVVEVLDREVLQMVFTEDSDAIHESFEDVLEHSAFAPDLDEHLEAIERA